MTAASRPPIADLPVPAGFSLNEGNSRSFAAAGMRWVDHIYSGPEDKYTIARFYKRNMPICRWTLMTDMFIRGKIMLDFEKEGERCRIIIDEGNVVFPSRVQAQVWTSGQVTTVTAAR